MSGTIDTWAPDRLARLLGLAAIVTAFTLDQTTKLIALGTLEHGVVQSVLPVFDMRLSFNRGVSFSLLTETFADHPQALAGISLAIAALLAFLLIRSISRWETVAFGLMIGGALGNALDRLRHGAVVDFLDFHVGNYHWPTFNLADTAIVFGVMLLIARAFLDRSSDNKSKEHPS